MRKHFWRMSFLSVPTVLMAIATAAETAVPAGAVTSEASVADATSPVTAGDLPKAEKGEAGGEATTPSKPIAVPLLPSDPKFISAQEAAAELDRRILAELQKAGVQPADVCNDEDFLRRASLDITGQLPTPSDVHAFRADTAPGKRAALIERLLASPEFGLNWGRYWRDVIYFRATEQRSRSNQEEFTLWMADQWNQGIGWNSTASAMLTAVGNVQEHPETALIFAQGAHTEDVAAEACRVFLGIQLQCANCHDHPTDVWKREQFHQLAAYFPRITERRVMKGKPEFEIASVNTENRRADLMRDYPDLFVRQFDRNNDHSLTRQELEKGPKRVGKKLAAAIQERTGASKGEAGDEMADASMKGEGAEDPKEKRKAARKKASMMKSSEMTKEEMDQGTMKNAGLVATKLNAKLIDRLFDTGDTNKDGLLTIEEIKAAQPPVNKRRGSTEHHMVNLLDPESEGVVIDPKFFVDGSTLPHGQSDQDRRQAVANSFVSPENPWFARAFVNRIWAEMLGEGFYMPIDDMGPTRSPRYPEVLEELCVNFVKNGYDPKWLVRTIANTAAYQRKIMSKSASGDELPFASATPVPLRSDIVFNSLAQVFGISEDEMGGAKREGGQR